jgi:asparagine synthase (glutamine-hydrolysing)
MMSAIAHRGPDGYGVWVEGPVGLGFNNLHTTPESLEEAQPLHDWESGDHLVCDARIDNRDDVRRELLALGHQLRTASDGELVLHAWQQWGEDCPMKFEGDFAIAAWNTRTQRLWCARDHLGCRTIYYYSSPKFFAFASEIKALLKLQEVPKKLDESQFLCFLLPALEYESQTATCFAGINRLQGGHRLSSSAESETLSDYWPLIDCNELPHLSIHDCARDFLETLSLVLRRQLRRAKPLAIAMSGGVDSTSLACLARGPLGACAGRPVGTISMFGPKGWGCPEAKGVQQILVGGGFEPVLLSPGDAVGPCGDVEGSLRNADDPTGVLTGHTYRTIYRNASERGYKIVMDGVDGDMPFPSGNALAALLMRKRMPLRAWSVLGSGSEPQSRLQGFRSSLLPAMFPRLYRGYCAARDIRMGCLQDEFVRSDFLERMNARDRLAAIRHRENVSRRSVQAHISHLFRDCRISIFTECYSQLAYDCGVEPRHPFLSRRIVEFAARIRPSVLSENRLSKPVLRLALAGILPDEIRLQRGGQNPGYLFAEKVLKVWSIRSRKEYDNYVENVSQYVKTDNIRKGNYSLPMFFRHDERWAMLCLGIWLDGQFARPKER